MKFRILKTVALLLVVVLVCSFNISFSPVSAEITFENNSNEKVALLNDSTNIEFNKVYAARFLNMLNHNFVYNKDFEEIENIVNSSMPALLELRDAELDSFIADIFVSDYIFNMYGIENIDFSVINPDFEQLDGFVYILPRGFSKYQHEIASITENEDGSFKVITNVKISSHDGGDSFDTCETLFVRNEKSSFGFSIISSNIGANALSV